MSSIRISFIIPFYNVEKYIVQCLDSVYAQDIPESEYEVICVNDVSPDNSLDLVLEYRRNHSNLKLIEHKENKLVGSARNTGLQVAQGQYVWFIDSDDCIKENVLKELLEIAERNDLEILQFNAIRFTNQGEFFGWENHFAFNTEIITGIDYLSIKYPYPSKPVTSWGKIFLRNFLLQNNLYFEEKVYFEDNLHTLRALLLTERFLFNPVDVYFYRMNPGSDMNNMNGKKIADYVRFHIQSLETIRDYEEYPFFAELKEHYCKVTKVALILLQDKPIKEKWIFYKKIGTFDRSILAKYSGFTTYYPLAHPWVIFILSFFPVSAYQKLKKWRNSYFNSI